MNNSNDPNAPTEHEIEGLLSSFKPRPTSRFFQRMRSAPWHSPAPSRIPSRPPMARPARRILLGLAIALVVLLMGVIIFVPPVRAIARQIIYSFISVPTNQIEVQVTPSKPGDLFNFSDPSNFPLSVGAAQQQAGFQVMQLSPVPEGFTLIGAHYARDYNTIIILYLGDHGSLFLTQRPLGNSQDVFSIGEQAIVQLVKIGDIQGEYVEGGWKAISTQSAGDNQTLENPVNITAIWDNSLPQSTLRWQVNNTAFELRTLGEGGPSQSDLILWANELK